jgi:putative FmdB family regulatory protein
MPLYEYDCEAHGVFELSRSMAESAARAACPECAAESPRILSTPNLRAAPRAAVLARDRNERSAHEPNVVTRAPAPSESAAPPRATASHGTRPWMLGHG